MKHIKFEENIEQDTIRPDSARKITNDVSDEQIPLTKKWYQELPEEPIDAKPQDSDRLAALKKEANSILHGESLAYETKMNRSGSSDQKWARSLLSKGAMADRVAAATILIQDSPLHHLSTLRNLVATVKPAKKKDSLTVIETLCELFLFDLLLPEAKLRNFESRPISELDKMCSGNRDHRRKILMLWIFEDQIKEIYGEFIKSLNNFAHDTIEVHKEKAVSIMSKLLMHNPEREKVLLSSIVNKLGDPSQKVASKVIYHLCQILYNHPNMKGVVLGEIEKMLFRPNISPKAQYYGICFLNQFFLSKDDNKLAENLVQVYFSFFKACIKKGDIDTRLMSAILTGVKRCQPFLDQQKVEELQNQADALHRLVHLAQYNVALHALALLFQISPVNTQLSDRYYCAFYKKLADPETLTTTLPALLMNLIYRSIKADKCESRVLAFLKRLLQLACMCDAPRACAFLLLIARLSRNKKLPLQWIIKPVDSLEIKDEEKQDDKPIESSADNNLNSDVNAIIEDDVVKSKKKKKKHQKDAQNSENTSGNEIEDDKKQTKIKPSSKTLWSGDKLDLLDDDDEEVYHDVILEEDEAEHEKKLKKRIAKKKDLPHGWVHVPESSKTDTNEELTEPNSKENDVKNKDLKILIKKSKNMEKVITSYMPYNRNPAFCGAENSVVCELLQLLNHYHPTVRLFSEKIINGSFVHYSGDPLKDFSIARFLDRFAFKNPKKDPSKIDEKEEGPQIKTVKGSHPRFAQRKNYLPGGLKSLPINSAAYLNEDSAHIPVDEKFLYDYLLMRKLKKGDESEEDDSDAGSVDSEEFERYLDNLSGKKNDNESEDSGDENEDLDFMTDVLKNAKNQEGIKSKKGSKSNEMEDEDGSDWDVSNDEADDQESLLSDIDDDSDLEFSDNDDPDLKSKTNKKNKKSKIDSDDESDIDFSDDDEDDGFDVPSLKKHGKKGLKIGKGTQSMFASAEEFSTLLEDAATIKGHGTSHAMANRENANMKQLDWESKRDRWVKGYNKPKFNKGKKFEKPSHGKNFNDSKFKKQFASGKNKRKFNEPGHRGGKKSRT